jgi:CheY-like chemotaxis protein
LEEDLTESTRERQAATILVVDDDALIAMNLAAILSDLGHVAIEAFSPRDALQVLSGGGAVDAMITDYSMPGMSGIELAHAARGLRPGLPIMVSTGHADLPEDTERVFPRLDKPFDERRLGEMLAALLGEREMEAGE